LYYWLVAAAAFVRGGEVDAWSVRLPAAAAAVVTVLAVAGFGWVRGRPFAGLAAAAVLAAAVYFTLLARTGRIDMPLTLCVGVAVLAFSLARRTQTSVGRIACCLLAYLSVAAAILLKGPIGAVLPAAVTGLHLLTEGELPPPWRLAAWGRLIHRLGLWWGAPLALALALPWFLSADAATHGEFFRVFVLRHNVERGLGGPTLKAHEWWFYARCFPVDFLPGTVLLVPAVVLFVWRGHWRTDPDARLGLAWFLASALVLSCASFKRADYLLPAYPGAALFVGCVLADEERRLRDTGRRIARLALCALPGILCVGMAGGWLVYVERELAVDEPARDCRAFAAEVRRRAPPPEEVIFFRTEAHAVAFNVGKPVAVLVEWGDLSDRLAAAPVRYVVTTADAAAQARQALPDVRFEQVLSNTELTPGGLHEHPLVLLRARKKSKEEG
jgi:4-amino-4-deoxy-L-arabinose transferase-like glycosyltransferase